MNKKKSLFVISGYLLITVLLIAGLILFNNSQQSSSKIAVLVSDNLIEKGTEMDNYIYLENNSPTTIREAEQHKSYKELIESGNDRLVAVNEKALLLSKSKKYIAVQDIHPNEPLKWSMFTNVETAPQSKEFVKPTFCKIPVEELSIPADGFEQCKEMSIVGLIPYKDDTTINLLTDKAVVYNTVASNDGKVTHVVMIVEETMYPIIELYANGDEGTSLRFLKGKVDSFALSSLAIKEYSYSTTGITTNFTDLKVNLTPVGNPEESYNPINLSTSDYQDENVTPNIIEDSLNIISGPSDLNDKKSYRLSNTGPCNDLFIYHYDLNGKVGINTGVYSHVSTVEENLMLVIE